LQASKDAPSFLAICAGNCLETLSILVSLAMKMVILSILKIPELSVILWSTAVAAYGGRFVLDKEGKDDDEAEEGSTECRLRNHSEELLASFARSCARNA
jgi:hypothetical protein